MEQPILFLLNPWREDGQGPYYCPACAVVEGFFHYSPAVREKIEIVYVDFPRPRDAIVALLGAEHQDCPVLVLGERPPDEMGAKQSLFTGKWFLDDGLAICRYLGTIYGGILPHP